MGYRFPRRARVPSRAVGRRLPATLPIREGAVYHSRARPWKTLDGGEPCSAGTAGGYAGRMRTGGRLRVGALRCSRYPHFIARLPNWRQIWLTALLTITVGRGDRSPASIRITQGIHERQAITLASQAHSARRRRRLDAWISGACACQGRLRSDRLCQWAGGARALE